MSVKITVNGKYVKSCNKHDLLNDPERVKRENENERRKLRIQQVRAASKNIASKVRQDVEMEKEKQLRKLEEIKAQEMEMWRQNMMAQHETNLKSAIFQVGTAHRAAKVETERQAHLRAQDKQNAAPKRPRRTPTQKDGKENNLKNANVQTDITGKCYPGPSTSGIGSRQRTAENAASNSESDVEYNSTSISTESYSDDLQDSLSSLSDSSEIIETKTQPRRRELHKRNPERVPRDSIQIAKAKKSINATTATSSVEQSAEKTSVKKKSTLEARNTDIASLTEDITKPSTVDGTRKRFTQISDILRQQKTSDKERSSIHQPEFSNAKMSPMQSKSPMKSKSKSPIDLSQQSGVSYTQDSPPKTKSRSFSTSHPINQTTASQATKSMVSSQSQSVRSSSARVQFYDYNNKFEKCYDHPPSAVEVEEVPVSGTQMNAMEQAELAAQLRKAREEEMEKLRQKQAERCQRAVEREQVRRACEELTVKLDALAKQRPIIPDDNRQFSSVRLSQVAAEQETKLNSALESILSRPAVITCPPVSRHEHTPLKTIKERPNEINLGTVINDINSLSSSDSCCSILLNFVNGQSKQVSEDIQKLNNQNIETGKEKAEKLQNLLSRINQLRESLINELEKYSSTSSPDKKRMQNMVDSISELRKERESILVEDKSNDSAVTGGFKKASAVEGDENIAKSGKSNKNNTISNKNTKQKDRLKSGRKLSSEEESEEFVGKQQFLLDDKPVEIVIKIRGESKSKKSKKLSTKSPRKLSTLIQTSSTKKSRKRSTSSLRTIDSNSTSYRSLPKEIHNNIEKVLVKSPQQLVAEPKKPSRTEDDKTIKLKKPSSTLNPLMAHYVQRLLGMSRNSINALGVNSSDIDTPSSSIINTTANLSAAETEKLASSRLENVQKFIQDNYSFINELEETIRLSNSESSMKVMENVWKNSLKEQKTVEKPHPIKGTQKPSHQTVKKVVKKQGIVQYNEKTTHADKCTQLTDTCTQRIAELSKMITKVRQEKQKILETTLSSVSENCRNSTEYLDLPDQRNNSEESTTKNISKSNEQLQTQSLNAELHLEKNKLTGISRDSGISISRPMTAQETRESPIGELIPSESSPDSITDQSKKQKPPISIARYSPILVEDVPHELSTIFEVETPATSRVNTSIHNTNNGQLPETLPQLHKERVKTVYRKFPTFEEYARLNQLDMSQFDPEFSVQFEKEYNEFIHLAKNGKIADYEQFASFSKYIAKSSDSNEKEAAEELFASLKLANMSFKKFPSRKEYLDKMGVSTAELLDSQSLDNAEESGKMISNSSSESLMNIENELKIRKILTKSFRQTVRLPVSDQTGKNTSGKADLSGIKNLTESAATNDEQSDNLESDLMQMGMNWPKTMKKKTKETQALSSTSSSAGQPKSSATKKAPNVRRTVETSYKKKSYAVYETTTQTEDGGRQLNLREFLTKELLKRTNTSSSLSLSEDSIASSILRSIIGSMTSSPQPQDNDGGTGLERQKTSTPMASHSGSSEKANSRSRASVQLFSGESLLSSVHFNNSSKITNKGMEESVPDMRK